MRIETKNCFISDMPRGLYLFLQVPARTEGTPVFGFQGGHPGCVGGLDHCELNSLNNTHLQNISSCKVLSEIANIYYLHSMKKPCFAHLIPAKNPTESLQFPLDFPPFSYFLTKENFTVSKPKNKPSQINVSLRITL